MLDGYGAPVTPIERYLAYLTQIERSPNTVKAYAHDLKDWFVFLGAQNLDWREVRLENVAEFVAWLRRPPQLRDGTVPILPSVEHHCTESTVNRKFSALSAFYQHAARHGVDLGELLRTWQPAGGRGSGWKPFHACDHLRDRFLFAVLFDTGMRIGEALGLRHEDIAAAESQITVQRRVNDNGARSKSCAPRTVPVSAELVRLYADYLHLEYDDLDSDYVFVNLWGRPHGHPLTYTAVYDLVKRLRRRTGIDFGPHWYRHTAATRMRRDGVPIEVVSKLLGHADITTTAAVYGHLSAEDARKALEEAGWFTGREVRL